MVVVNIIAAKEEVGGSRTKSYKKRESLQIQENLRPTRSHSKDPVASVLHLKGSFKFETMHDKKTSG